jgi:tetratricopeptide (TPR) repeat protein
MQDYSVAETRLSRTDPALLYSQVRAQILANKPVDLRRRKDLETALDDGLVCAQLGDSARVAAVLALAHAHAGNVDQTAATWQRVSDVAEIGPELVCEICQWLHSRAHSRNMSTALALCARILEQRLGVDSSPLAKDELMLVRQRARTLFGLGDTPGALEQLERLLRRHSHNAPLFAEAALLAVLSQEFQRAARYCSQALQLKQIPDTDCPVDAASWDAAIGLVYWLMGMQAEARECHRRSGRGEDEWFAVNHSEQFGLARAHPSDHAIRGSVSSAI